MHRNLAAFLIGLAVLSPACATAPVHRDRPAPPPRQASSSAYDEGFKRGLMSGGWAGHRDLGKPHRHNFWKDGQYRQGTEGYRPSYGSKLAYTDGFRAGYEKGYHQSRDRERRKRQ